MTMALDLRKFALTVHVIVSVGWAGAVAAFLALAVAGLVSPDIPLVRASYLAMDLTYRIVIIPLGLASLGTGLVSSLATEWVLLRQRRKPQAQRIGDDADGRQRHRQRRDHG